MAKHILKNLEVFTSQDFISTFGHFTTLDMKGLRCTHWGQANKSSTVVIDVGINDILRDSNQSNIDGLLENIKNVFKM